MKRKLVAVLFVSVLALLLTGCCIKHDWQEATCEAPKTCAKCGKTEGTALGHEWQEANCAAPRTCSACGKTEGEALGHKWGEWKETVAPTAKEEGKEERVCATCGRTQEQTVPCIENDFLGTWKAYKSVIDGRETKFSDFKGDVELTLSFVDEGLVSVHWYFLGKEADGYPMVGPYTLIDHNLASLGSKAGDVHFKIVEDRLLYYLNDSSVYYFRK